MLTPVQNLLSTLLTQGLTLAPIIIGLAIFIAGAIMAAGDHRKGREGVLFALVGGALMLGSQTIASAVHP